jgi:outer membrane protein assembly factor BamC
MTIFTQRFPLKRLLSKLWLIPLVVSMVSACSWLGIGGEEGMFRDRGGDYRKAKLKPPLNIPQGLDSESLSDSYAIPQADDDSSLEGDFELPAPEPLSAAVERDIVRINKLAGVQWILVDGTPGEIWPRLRGFLSLNQFPVLRADAVNGILETAWMQPNEEGVLRERFRIRIDQGVQRSTSEVYVLHADIRAGEDWPQSSSSSEREDIMINELSQYLADSATSASVSMLAQQGIDSSGKVKLQEDASQQPLIELQLPFSRGWASLGRAISKAGFNVDDLNREGKTYYVHYLEPDPDDDDTPGFFANLFSWSSDDEKVAGIAYNIDVKEKNSSAIIITIERQGGEEMLEGEALHLLKLIKRYLS